MPLISAVSWAAGPTSAPVIPKTFHSPGNPPGGGGGGGGNYGYGSTLFDGTGDYLESASSLDFTMGTGDFTVECWFKPGFNTSTNYTHHKYLWEIGNQRVYITIDNGTLYLANAFIGAIANVSIGNIQGEWHHVAVTKQSNTYKLWYDGQLQGSGSDSNEITGPTGNEDLIFRIAFHTYFSGGNYYFPGHVSNLRVIKGTAFYTSNFTVPTSPLTKVTNTVLLTCQDTTGTITDNSNSNHTMTVFGDTVATTNSPFVDPNYTPRGSTYFDGTGDSLDVGTFTIGTSAFTIENWFQPKFNTNGSDTVFLYDVSSEDIRVTFKNGNIRAQLGGETELSYSIGTLDYNTWYYNALQRDSSGNVNFYFNGGVVGNYSGSGQNVSGNTLRIADKQAGSKEFHGYISNFRIVKGNALYPPANGGSASFDGTGDYIDTTNPLPVTGDFTIEGWIYPTSSGLYDGYFSTCLDTGASGGIVVGKDKFFVTHGGGSSQIGFSDTIENNVWSHIVLQRKSNVFSLYKDGILQGTTTVTVSLTGSTLRLGSRYSNNTSNMLTGFLSNFRIVDSTPYSPAGGSAYFDGTDDYLKVSNNTSFALGTGDFTIECWVYFTDTSLESGSNRRIFNLHETGNAVDNLQIVIDNGGYRKAGDLFLYSNSIQGYLDTDIRSGWHHIAVVRNSGTLKFYLDGVSKYSASNTQDYSPGGAGGPRPTIGSRGDDKGDYKGNISNFRMVVGTAVYTSNFTPSTSALTDITNTQLLTCQNSSGAITDNSSNSHVVNTFGGVIASGSNPFNSNTNFTVPTSPLTAISGTQLLTCQNGTGSITDASSNNYTITPNGNTTASGSSPFAKSTTPLTDITNTKLLTCQNNTGAITDASSNNHTVTANGNAQASTLHPFNANGSTNGSYYFSSLNAWNGTNARVITADSNDFNLPDGTDVTVEFWYKIPVTPPTSGNGYLFDLGDGNYGWLAAYAWNQNGTHTLRVGTYFGAIWLADEDLVGMIQNQWYHLAITRESGVWKVYLDGVFQGSKANSALGSFDSYPDRISLGGYHNMTYPNYGVVSYISDFRFVKGLAVYTGNFSPPSGPLTTTGGTYPSTANITNPTSAQTLLLTAQNSSGSFVDNSQYSRSLTSYNTVTTEAGVPY